MALNIFYLIKNVSNLFLYRCRTCGEDKGGVNYIG